MLPSEFCDEVLQIGISFGDFLARLDALAETAECPICRRNKGWAAPPGIERVTLATTREQPAEALPFMCDWCGFVRLHVVSGYRQDD